MEKKLKFSSYLLAALVSVFLIAGCSEKDDWKPGPKPAENNPGVYFDRNTPRTAELDVDAQLNLISDYFPITLGRDPFKASQSLRVPITILFADKNLSVPDFVEFAAGSETAELRVGLNNFELSKPYGLSLAIDDSYTNNYLSYAGSDEGGASRVDLNIRVVAALGTVTFTPGNYSSSGPQFTPFTHKIYINEGGSYTIHNFLYNNAGYDFTFTLDENNHIIPDPDFGYFEEGSGSSARWYFYSAPSSSSSNYIPCYIPGLDPTDNIRYIYFYLDPGYSNFGFSLDIPNKTGVMVGYARYTNSSSGRITFSMSWH